MGKESCSVIDLFYPVFNFLIGGRPASSPEPLIRKDEKSAYLFLIMALEA